MMLRRDVEGEDGRAAVDVFVQQAIFAAAVETEEDELGSVDRRVVFL